MTAAEFDRWSVHRSTGFVRQQVAAGPAARGRRPARRGAGVRRAAPGRPGHRAPPRPAGAGPRDRRDGRQPVAAGASRTGRGRGLRVRHRAAARGARDGAWDGPRCWPPTRPPVRWAPPSMRLNVFGHNAPAIALYESLGYAVADVSMHRRLDGPRAPSPDGPGTSSCAPMTLAGALRRSRRASGAPRRVAARRLRDPGPAALDGVRRHRSRRRRVARPARPVGRAARVRPPARGPRGPASAWLRPGRRRGRPAHLPRDGCAHRRAVGRREPMRRPAGSARSWGSPSLRRRWCCR